MTNFSVGGTFTTVVRIFAKLAFFNYLCRQSGGVTSRFWVFWNLVQIDVLIWLKYFAGMFTSLFDSMTSRYCFGKSQFRITKKSYYSCHKQSYSLLKSHKEFQIHSLSFFSSVTKSWKLCPSCCWYGKKTNDGVLWCSFLGCSIQKTSVTQMQVSFHHQGYKN